MLAFILLGLSFDEVAGLHEQMSWLVYGVTGISMLTFVIVEFAIGRADRRVIALILLGFSLFGTIAIQEHLQATLIWDNQVIYGARAALEEGTELAAMLILISVARNNTRALLGKRPLCALSSASHRTELISAAIILAPVLAVATVMLPFPGGPADWLAACLYLLSALVIVRAVLIGQRALTIRVSCLLGMYLVASAMSSMIRITNDLVIMDMPISVRGLFLSAILLTASVLVRTTGRQAAGVVMRICAALIFLTSFWSPDMSALSQLVWCLIPSAVALLIFSIESRDFNKSSIRDDSWM